MKKNYYALLVILISFVSSSYAQFSVDGEFRPRGIVENGFKFPALKNDQNRLSFDQRSRISFNYTTPKYSSRLTLQDARIWGSDDIVNKTGTESSSYSFGVYEAWIDLKLNDNSGLRIGRQEWKYDDMRILSSRNFWTSGQNYDGLLYHYSNKEKQLKVDLGFSYNNNGSTMGIIVDNSEWESDKLKSMNFLHLSKTFSPKLNAALIFTLAGKTDISNNAVLGTGTHGLNLSYNRGKGSDNGLFAYTSAYYQHGTDMKRGSDGDYKSISAYMITAQLGVRTSNKKLELSLGMELISGHDYSNTDEDYNNTRHSFDLLQSARVPYYGGYMNHFIIQDSYLVGTKGGGYFDPYIKAKYNINKKNIIEAGFYMPSLTTKVRAHTGINPDTNKPIGSELDENGNPVYWKGGLGHYLDILYTHKASKDIILKAGLSYGQISDIKNQMAYGYSDITTKTLHEVDPNYFGWVMLIVKPQFFSSSK